MLCKEANLVILPMSSFTYKAARSHKPALNDPDLDTLSKWLAPFEPILRDETNGEIICVFANRTGHEDGILYTGTSTVLGIHGGEVKVYGMLGCGEEELLIVDTKQPAQRKLVQGPISGTREVTLSIVDAIPQKFFARTASAKPQNTSGTGQQVTVPQIPTKTFRKSLSAHRNVVDRGRTSHQIEHAPQPPKSSISRNSSKAKPVYDLSIASRIPSWLPRTTWDKKVAIVIMTQAKELDKEFWVYLSQKVQVVDPRYVVVVIRTEKVESKLELHKFYKLIGPWERGIVAIHAYVPEKPVYSTFQFHWSAEEYTLYKAVDENQVSSAVDAKHLGIPIVQQGDDGDAKPWHNGEELIDPDLIAVYDLGSLATRPVPPKSRNSSHAPAAQNKMLQRIVGQNPCPALSLESVLSEEMKDEVNDGVKDEVKGDLKGDVKGEVK